MKKLLLALLSLISIQLQGMVTEKVVFNFADLKSLTVSPTLTEPQFNLIYSGDGVRLQCNDRTFTAGPVTLNFTQSLNTAGAGFSHYGEITTLTIGKFTSIKFKLSGGCVLSSITFNRVSDIYMEDGQPGRVLSDHMTWDAQTSTPTEVVITKGAQDSQFDNITVTYQRPSTPLDFLSSNPASGSTFTGVFKTMALDFSTVVTKINNASSITLTGSDVDNQPISQKMSASGIGSSTITLTAEQPIEKDATLKLSIPAGTFENSEGASNKAIDVPFTVKAKRDTFNPITIEPAPGTVGELPEEIRLTFDNFATPGTGFVKFKQTEGGEANFPSSAIEVDAENKKVGIIKHANGKQVDPATWTVEIPAGIFHNQYYNVDDVEDRWNSAVTLTYVVDGSMVGPQDSPTMKEAKKLLQQTGVGYPTTTAATYKALSDLVNAEETPADEALSIAITNLYNETAIEMPAKDKWYKIAGVNTAGNRLYLTLNADHNAVVLDTKEASAAAFKVTESVEGKVVLQTKEGLYLHIPTVLPMHEGTTDSNLTPEDKLSDINKLTFAKFVASSVEGADPAALYGAYTIYGSLGKETVLNVEQFAYAMLNHSTTKVTTYPNFPLTFSEDNSNAFVLIETTEPVDYVDMIYPTVGLRPDAVNNTEELMELVIYGPASTTIADASKIFYTKSSAGEDNNEKVTFEGTILTPIADKANTFKVNLTGLAPGMYNIVMEKGAFEFVAPEGKSVYNFDLSRELTIRGGETPTPTPTPVGDVEPTAQVSPITLFKAGEDLLLVIGNVNKAILKDASLPYFVYNSGDKKDEKVPYTMTILTAKANKLADFGVTTTGLDAGQYTLVLPAGTFIFEAKESGKTVKDMELKVNFTINSSDKPTTNFTEFDNFPVSFINPNTVHTTSVVFKDIVLNDLIVFAYQFDLPGGIVPGTGKVMVKSTSWGSTAVEGKLVSYPNFNKDFGSIMGMDYSQASALRFVPDKPIEAGELNNSPGTYQFFFEPAAFGDANYGKWLANPNSVAAADCKVNSGKVVGPVFQINNDTGYDPTATAIRTVTKDYQEQQATIFDMSGRRVEDMSKKGVYIINGKKIVIK